MICPGLATAQGATGQTEWQVNASVCSTIDMFSGETPLPAGGCCQGSFILDLSQLVGLFPSDWELAEITNGCGVSSLHLQLPPVDGIRAVFSSIVTTTNNTPSFRVNFTVYNCGSSQIPGSLPPGKLVDFAAKISFNMIFNP